MKPVRINVKGLERLSLDRYVLEKKYDGHRAILVADGGKKRLLTRQKNPITIPASLQEQLRELLSYCESRSPRDEDGSFDGGYYESMYEFPAYRDIADKLRPMLDGE